MVCLHYFTPGKNLVFVELLHFACIKGVKKISLIILLKNKVLEKITEYGSY